MTAAAARQPTQADEEAMSTAIRFGGQVFEPLLSGALYWRGAATLLVADLHFDKFASFARKGIMLPPYDTSLTLRRLEADLDRTGATRVVALGDSFHRNDSPERLLPADRARLEALLARAAWTWIGGNHDPAPHALGGECRTEVAEAGLVFTHVPRRGVRGMVAGHLHPAAAVLGNGAVARGPCFVHDGRLMLLPAYGAGTGSINILGPAFDGLFNRASLEVTMIGRSRLYAVSPRRLVRAGF